MHIFHVPFIGFPQSKRFATKLAFELARRWLCCDVVQPLLVVIQTSFLRVTFVALITLELALVFRLDITHVLQLLWVVCLVVGAQLFHAVVVTLADWTDDVSTYHLKARK